MSMKLFAAYNIDNAPATQNGVKITIPERLVLGRYDDELDTGNTSLVIEGEDFKYLFKALEAGYTITKKESQGE